MFGTNIKQHLCACCGCVMQVHLSNAGEVFLLSQRKWKQTDHESHETMKSILSISANGIKLIANKAENLYMNDICQNQYARSVI